MSSSLSSPVESGTDLGTDVEKAEGESAAQSGRSSGQTPANALPDSDHEKSGPAQPRDEKEAFKVGWDEDEPANPRNFSTLYKAWITFVLGMLALAASLGSSIIAPAEDDLASWLGVSSEVTVLTISLYVLGFAFGPLIWAPVSEMFGRKWSMLPAMFCLGLFSIGTATSNSLAAILVTRFFGGIFGSAPVSNVSAALGDIYAPKVRGTAVTFYAVAVVGGPTLGPVIGSALTVNPNLGWRWTEYILAIWVFVVCIIGFFGMPELYPPVLLARKARRLRKETGDQRYWHPHENEKLDFNSVVTKHLSRPLLMLTTEPMVMCIALYASFVFGLLYLTLEVFPIVYGEERHYSLVVSSLFFIPLFIGVLSAVFINLANQPRYFRAVDRNKGRAVPEARMVPMVVGGWLFVIGLFWFGWTANPKFHWAISAVAIAFIGAGFNVIFQQCINVLIDCYGLYGASAVSANTFLRSLMAAGLPLAAGPMFRNLGVGPASSILGAVAALALPVPFIFMKYGLKLRKMSRFAPVEED